MSVPAARLAARGGAHGPTGAIKPDFAAFLQRQRHRGRSAVRRLSEEIKRMRAVSALGSRAVQPIEMRPGQLTGFSTGGTFIRPGFLRLSASHRGAPCHLAHAPLFHLSAGAVWCAPDEPAIGRLQDGGWMFEQKLYSAFEIGGSLSIHFEGGWDRARRPSLRSPSRSGVTWPALVVSAAADQTITAVVSG